MHVGDIVNEKRINHPQDELKVGHTVRAVVLENDWQETAPAARAEAIAADICSITWIAEHKEGEEITGRLRGGTAAGGLR